MAGLNGIAFKFANLNIRLDQLLAVILIIFLIFDLLIGRKKLYIDLPGKFLIMFFIVSFFSSYVYSPDRNYSIIQTINILSAASVYFIIPNSITDIKIETKFLKSFVYAGIIMCVMGVALFIIAHLGITDYGVNLIDDPTTTPYGVYSTMLEPNIYGSYSVIYFIFALNMLLIKDFSTIKKRILVYLLFVSAAGVLLSFTRGAWLAALISIFMSLIILKKRHRKKKLIKQFATYLSFAGIVIVAIVGFAISNYFLLYKINNFLNASSGTGYGRIEIWTLAIGNIPNHLLLGNGTYSFAAIYATRFYDPRHNAWIGNFLVTILHDTGIIGIIFFFGFLIILLGKGILKRNENEANANNIELFPFSLSMSSIAMLIAFFFTTGFSFTYAWIPFGLISYFNNKRKLNYT